MKLLYRPSFANQLDDHLRAAASASGSGSGGRASRRNVVLTNYSNAGDVGNSGGRGDGSGGGERSRGGRHATSRAPVNDPPPKYTPPPSYSTATGARLARFLRQSFRQSMRRLRDISGNVGSNVEPGRSATVRSDGATANAVLSAVSLTLSTHKAEGGDNMLGSPPDYEAVLVEEGRMQQQQQPVRQPRRRDELPPDISVTR